MQIDYVRKNKKPVIDEHYIKTVVDKHYPGFQGLLQEVEDKWADKARSKNSKQILRSLKNIADANERMEYASLVNEGNKKEDTAEIIELKARVVQGIQMVTSQYDTATIETIVDQLLATEEGRLAAKDETAMTRLTFRSLNDMGRKRKRRVPALTDKEISSFLQNTLEEEDK